MHIIFTNEELEARWKNMGVPPDHIMDRDVRHLATLADMEGYEQHHDRGEDVLGFWRNMTHKARVKPTVTGEGAMAILYASNLYFRDREVVKVQVYDHGEIVKISFGDWMDTETLEIYQDVFREWMDIIRVTKCKVKED
jgi:hypothetical protein